MLGELNISNSSAEEWTIYTFGTYSSFLWCQEYVDENIGAWEHFYHNSFGNCEAFS